MNTLALLCNLHADGPATLQRLRRAGCESLSSLARLDARDLAQSLGWSERAAERFQREAALLAERLDEDVGEDAAPPALQEDEQEAEFELESSVIEELSAEGEDEAGESELEDDEEVEEEGEAGEVESGYAPPPERVQAVLGTWRELDRVDPPGEPAPFVIPRPVTGHGPDRALAAGLVEGLSRELCDRLAALGVRTLRALATAQPLELARAVGLGYTRLKHLQFLAVRELANLPAPVVEPLREERGSFDVFTPPPVEPFETAGPFA